MAVNQRYPRYFGSWPQYPAWRPFPGTWPARAAVWRLGARTAGRRAALAAGAVMDWMSRQTRERPLAAAGQAAGWRRANRARVGRGSRPCFDPARGQADTEGVTEGPKQAAGATAQICGEPPGRVVRGQGGASRAGGAASQRSPLQWLACGGVAGPVLFTAAWVISSLRQAGHPPAQVQLSGLAAMDARDPQIMIAGFAALGVGTLALAAALWRLPAPPAGEAAPPAGEAVPPAGEAAPPPGGSSGLPRPGRAGPALLGCAGAAALAAGVFRRDHLLLSGPGFAGESWHNQVHDVASGAGYAAMILAPLVLAREFGRQPGWRPLARPVAVLALATAGLLAVFGSRWLAGWDGVLQRAAVTLALAAEVLIAARLLGPGCRGTGRPGTGRLSRWLPGPGRWRTGRAGPGPGEEP
jgi:hypothetical protein